MKGNKVDVNKIIDLLKRVLLTPKVLDKKPTIAELEKILNSDEGANIAILPNSEIAVMNPSISIEKLAQEIAIAIENGSFNKEPK